MHKLQEGIGEHGERVPGPPWILGHRGAPRLAPENTLSSLQVALELGLDGVEYDLHACASGEPVLLHDETLDRTTDARGPIAARTLAELAGIDAGGWFSKRFRGEPLPLFEEALTLPGRPGEPPRHMIELKDPDLVPEVARVLASLATPLRVHVASFQRAVCLEARDRGLASMLLALDADEDDRRFVRDERIAAYGTAPGGWRSTSPEEPWECERWSWSVDEPEDLLAACRAPLVGFNTNEPLRALAARALVALAPADGGPWPLEVPHLEVGLLDERASAVHGEWSGRWTSEIGLRNPFGFPVEVRLEAEWKGGAFEAQGFSAGLRLAAGERVTLAARVAGGSWSPHEDPLVRASFSWSQSPGRPPERLVLDAPLARRRSVALGEESVRLPLLRERPGQPPASMTLRRRNDELLAWIEDPGGLEDVRALLRLDSDVRTGGRGVRAFLPLDFDRRPGGVPFSVGFEGRLPGSGERELRRYCGGLPYGLSSGATGLLFPARS